MNRMVIGSDAALLRAISESEKWTGSYEELVGIVAAQSSLAQPTNLPVREAIDWVNATLYTTVKVTKFTHLPPICGGPIDIAVVTTDRLFRWVRRKQLSSGTHDLSLEF
jgi:hypothetical protein